MVQTSSPSHSVQDSGDVISGDWCEGSGAIGCIYLRKGVQLDQGEAKVAVTDDAISQREREVQKERHQHQAHKVPEQCLGEENG